MEQDPSVAEEVRRIKAMPWHRRWQIYGASWLAYLLIRLLHATWRYEVVGDGQRRSAEIWPGRCGFAIATWHQNAILGITGHRHQGICILISASVDGEIVSWIANRLGLPSIRGSSSRGGRQALLNLARYVRNGGRVAFTVDGPRGPRHQVKPGIISLASRTGAPILPMAAIADRYWTLKRTWDEFRIPKPFAKVKVIYGRPLIVSKELPEADFRHAQEQLTAALHRLDPAIDGQSEDR